MLEKFLSIVVLISYASTTTEEKQTSIPEALTPVQTQEASEFYVSPDGNAEGDGSKERPLDIVTALAADAIPIGPGDTVWLRGGIYTAGIKGFFCDLQGKPEKPIIVRNYPGERVTIDGGFTLWGADTWIWGLEITSLSPLPSSTLSLDEFWMLLEEGTERNSNLHGNSRGSKVINCVIHHNLLSGSLSVGFSDSEFYGNLVCDNGWMGRDYADGHGLYVQNQYGIKQISDNIIANNFVEGLHIYSAETASVNHTHVKGNILFGNGTSSSPGGRNMLVGSAIVVEGLVVQDNVLYNYPGANKPNLITGYGGPMADAIIRNNLAVHGAFALQNTTTILMTGNTIAGPGLLQIDWPEDPTAPTFYTIDGNHYFNVQYNSNLYDVGGQYLQFKFDRTLADFQQWQNIFGFDRNSDFVAEDPSGVDVIVRPNRFEAGRANIAIINWSLQEIVEVNIGGLLPFGSAYQIRDASNYYGEPVLGVYDGAPIGIRMNGAEFKALVLLPVSKQALSTLEATPNTAPPSIDSPRQKGGVHSQGSSQAPSQGREPDRKLKFYPPVRSDFGGLRLAIGSGDGSPVDSIRASKIRVLAGDQPGGTAGNWVQLTNSVVLKDGKLWIQMEKSNLNQRFFKMEEER